MGGDGRITATAQKFDRVERLTDVNLEEIDGDLFPEEPSRIPDDDDRDEDTDDEDDSDDADDPEADDLNGL